MHSPQSRSDDPANPRPEAAGDTAAAIAARKTSFSDLSAAMEEISVDPAALPLLTPRGEG